MATHRAAAQVAEPEKPGTQQFLTFELGNETYGVEILQVQEIRGWTPVIKIPQAPPQVLGVLNLRGSIVPVVDMRMCVALERTEYTKVTVVIVLSVNTCAGRRQVGVVVDGVSDVVDVDAANVKPSPDLGTTFSTSHIRGLVSIAGRMVMLLDIDRLIGTQLTSVSTGQQGQEPTVAAA